MSHGRLYPQIHDRNGVRMKITNNSYYSVKVVLDIETLEVLEDVRIPYEGPWELADGAPDAAPPAPTPEPTPDATPSSPDSVLDQYVEGADTPPTPEPTEPQEPQPGTEPKEGEPQQPVPQQDTQADKTLKAIYRENSGHVKEFIQQHPELRAAFFKGAELSELFKTVEDAKQAQEWSGQLYKFDNLYYSPNPEDKRAFIQSLYDNSLEADGSSPHYDQVASMFVGDGLSNLARLVQQGDPNISRVFSEVGLNGKQAMVAVQAVAAMFGIPLQGLTFSPSATSAPGSAPGTMSEREQYLNNEVQRLSEEIRRSHENTLVQSEQTFNNTVRNSFYSNLQGSIAEAIKPATALATQKLGFQNWVKSEILARVDQAIRSDEQFGNQIGAMMRSGDRGQEHQQRLVAALEQRARHYLPDVLREVLAEAGITIQQTANANKSQAGPGRREPTTSGTPGRLTQPGKAGPKPQPGESYEQFSRRTLEIE